jgi:hypothetical protein
MAYGFTSHVGIARETTWGSPVSVASGDYIEALSETLPLVIDRFDTRNIAGKYAEPDDTPGLRRIEGELVAMGHPHYLGFFLRGLTNSGSFTAVASGFLHKYTYYTPTTDASTLAPVPSYTVEVFRDVTSSNRYSGVVFNRGVFAVQPNQEVRFTGTIIAKTTSVVAKGTPTYCGSPVDPFTFDSASISIAGGASPYVEALTLTIDNQLVAVNALANTYEIVSIKRNGPQQTLLSGTFTFENLTEYNNFVNQTEQRWVVNFFRANSFNLTIDLPRVVYTAHPLGVPGRERLTVAFEAKARYHAGSATAYQIDLTTTKSGF